MLGIVSSCAILTVLKMRRFYDFEFKNVVTFKSVSEVTQGVKVIEGGTIR